MVQGIFDDRNSETASQWAYPDTGKWDAERNTREFIAAMPEGYRHLAYIQTRIKDSRRSGSTGFVM